MLKNLLAKLFGPKTKTKLVTKTKSVSYDVGRTTMQVIMIDGRIYLHEIEGYILSDEYSTYRYTASSLYVTFLDSLNHNGFIQLKQPSYSVAVKRQDIKELINIQHSDKVIVREERYTERVPAEDDPKEG